MVLCKDCKYFDSGWIGSDTYIGPPLCKRPIKSFTYGTRPINKDPEKERNQGKCGKEGIFFSNKESKQSFWSRIFKK